MDEAAARRALGVAPDAPWTTVRAAYRTAISAAHPDRAGGSTARAATLNAAYAALVRARRTPAAPNAPAPPPPPAPVRAYVGPVEVLDGDTIRLPVPADEAFLVILEACHRIGAVTYVDRSCAILETLVAVEGEGACSLVVTFQGRAHGTDAFCTLEAIEHVGSPPVGPVVAALREAIGA
jgi:hypothetical protein